MKTISKLPNPMMMNIGVLSMPAIRSTRFNLALLMILLQAGVACFFTEELNVGKISSTIELTEICISKVLLESLILFEDSFPESILEDCKLSLEELHEDDKDGSIIVIDSNDADADGVILMDVSMDVLLEDFDDEIDGDCGDVSLDVVEGIVVALSFDGVNKDDVGDGLCVVDVCDELVGVGVIVDVSVTICVDVIVSMVRDVDVIILIVRDGAWGELYTPAKTKSCNTLLIPNNRYYINLCQHIFWNIAFFILIETNRYLINQIFTVYKNLHRNKSNNINVSKSNLIYYFIIYYLTSKLETYILP